MSGWEYSLHVMRRFSIRHLCGALLWVLLLAGCSVKPQLPTSSRIQQLTHQLRSLDPAIPQAEAKSLASDLFATTATLVRHYELTAPPLWHNFLVNIGLRHKGLCYDFSDALFLHLRKERYPHFAFHLAVANRGAYFKEHNALLIIAKGKEAEQGLIVDAWRHSGRLYVVPFDKDKTYRWRHRSERCLCE